MGCTGVLWDRLVHVGGGERVGETGVGRVGETGVGRVGRVGRGSPHALSHMEAGVLTEGTDK